MSEGRKAPRNRGADSPITRQRMARGLTQAQLAEAVGCLQKDISRYEHGTRNPKPQILAKLAKALDCKMEDLIT